MMVTNAAWRRGFVKLPAVTCMIGVIFPFIIFTPFVKFQPGLGDDGGNLNPFQKLFVFYRSPVIKYTGTCFSYLILILLYSYVTLFGFRYEYQVPEVVLYCWIFILILDEIREVFSTVSLKFFRQFLFLSVVDRTFKVLEGQTCRLHWRSLEQI